MKILSKINYITKSLQIVFKTTQITIRDIYVGDKFINILLYNFTKFGSILFQFLSNNIGKKRKRKKSRHLL